MVKGNAKKLGQVWMRIDDIKSDLQRAAEQDFRSLNDEIRWLLMLALELREVARTSSIKSRNVQRGRGAKQYAA